MASPSTSPSQPTASQPPLARSQFAAYASFLADLGSSTAHDLSQRLANRFYPDEEVYADDEIILSDDSETPEAGSGRERSQSGSRAMSAQVSSQVRRVEGSYTGTSQLGKRKRKGKGREDPIAERSETLWPLALSELDDAPGLVETITSFAESYIREQRLILPNLRREKPNAEDDSSDDSEDNEADPVIPPNLASSVIEMLNEVLTNLAGVRPCGSLKMRKGMKAMDWEGVLDVAGMIPGIRPQLASANTRLRALYTESGPDILGHRLQLLEHLKTSRLSQPPLQKSLYASVLTTRNPLLRPHISQQEQAERAKKRLLKEQTRVEKQKKAREMKERDMRREEEKRKKEEKMEGRIKAKKERARRKREEKKRAEGMAK